MNFYIKSFLIFTRIGAFTIGGGYAMVPLIENELVDKRKWVSKEDFLDLMALAQTVPGIFAVGDVRKKSLRQITTAVGDGAEAGNRAFTYVEAWNEENETK